MRSANDRLQMQLNAKLYIKRLTDLLWSNKYYLLIVVFNIIDSSQG